MSGNKTHTNRFCRCTGKYKALGLNAQTSQTRSVLLRPRALYFPVQHKTGWYVHIIKSLKLFRFSADFTSFDKPFNIFGPTDSGLFEPKLLDLVLYSSYMS